MRQIPLAFAAAALLSAGCASHEPMHMGGPSIAKVNACKKMGNAADCYIVVDADFDQATNKCRSVNVVASQADVEFLASAKDKWVHWWLTGSAVEQGFRFSRDGIAPKSNPPGSAANVRGWNDNFKTGGAYDGGEKYKWKNANDASQPITEYQYLVAVEVRGTGGATVTCTQDPVIRNQR